MHWLTTTTTEEISNFRTELTDLLWDFDDYVEADAFEADEFAKLQALSRKAAPKIYDILMRMRLEVPVVNDNRHFMSQLSPPSSPHPGPLSPAQSTGFLREGHTPATRSSMSGSQTDARSLADRQLVEDATTQMENHVAQGRMPSIQSNVIGAGYIESQEAYEVTAAPQPPPPPSDDPWDPQHAPRVEDYDHDTTDVERRPTVHRPESPVDPAISPMSPDNRRRLGSAPQRSSGGAMGFSDSDSHEHDPHRQSVSSTNSNFMGGYAPTSQRPRTATLSPSIPEEGHVSPRSGRPPMYVEQLQVRPPPVPPLLPNRNHSLPQRQPNIYSTDDVEDINRQYVNPNAPPPSAPLPPPPVPVKDHGTAVGRTGSESQSGPDTPTTQPGLEVAFHDDPGLIPVSSEAQDTPSERQLSLTPKDCAIGSGSSFYLYKGFCEGAKEVVRGEIGVKKTKKPGFQTALTVARCTHCLFELDFTQIEIDINKEDKGNYQKSGIEYRLRFLQKSHLPAKRVDDVLYGCVFCIQAGRTLDECDSTVFTTTKALFTHMARHARPFPNIDGIAVVDQPEMPVNLRNDYDVHFISPPVAHPAQLNLSQITGLPTGVAKDHSRRIYGQKLLFDRSPALELCHGAKITGITWPEKYNGDWIFAWHDGIFASAPAEIIRLEAPPQGEIRMVGSSLVRAKARWKFQQKEKDKNKDTDAASWLKIDKNDVITNISCKLPAFNRVYHPITDDIR